ncbi:MAG: hypothetical protein ABJB85_10310 [Nitrososphaerota archaeon]
MTLIGNLQTPHDWETPSFVKIKRKKTKRLSPYLETELWDKDELALIIKYEQFNYTIFAAFFSFL